MDIPPCISSDGDMWISRLGRWHFINMMGELSQSLISILVKQVSFDVTNQANPRDLKI